MLKIFFILSIGVAAGYSFGFKDAKAHDDPIVTRLVERIGGDARKNVGNDIDGRLEGMEKR